MSGSIHHHHPGWNIPQSGIALCSNQGETYFFFPLSQELSRPVLAMLGDLNRNSKIWFPRVRKC